MVRIVFIGLMRIFFFLSKVVNFWFIDICLSNGFIIVGFVIIIREVYKNVIG